MNVSYKSCQGKHYRPTTTRPCCKNSNASVHAPACAGSPILDPQSPPTVKLLPRLRPYVGIGVVALGLGLLCCTAAWLGTGV